MRGNEENGGFTPTRPNMPFYLAPTVIVCSAPRDYQTQVERM